MRLQNELLQQQSAAADIQAQYHRARITADPATNALIITAAPEDYSLLLGVVEKLDIRRRQVYVEAELAIRKMRTGLPVRFATAQGGVRIEGALVECDADSGRALGIEAVRVSLA